MAEPKQRPITHDEPAAELESSRMPFLQHLGELRDRVRNAAIAFAIAAVVCFLKSDEIFDWLKEPLFNVWDREKLGAPHLVFGMLTEPFWVNMSIALWAGVFAASPFIFYQLWKFVAPGLYKRERKITVTFAVCSAILFTGGAVFCRYYVIESLYGFLITYSEKDQLPMITMQGYLDLTRDMMLAFGAVFELPLLIYFLALVGLVTHRGLWKFNRWFVVIAFIISQLLMALPMIVLYNISILLAWQVTAKRERADAAQRAKEDASE
jgi:sec-independent protein translocase protein TatC